MIKDIQAGHNIPRLCNCLKSVQSYKTLNKDLLQLAIKVGKISFGKENAWVGVYYTRFSNVQVRYISPPVRQLIIQKQRQVWIDWSKLMELIHTSLQAKIQQLHLTADCYCHKYYSSVYLYACTCTINMELTKNLWKFNFRGRHITPYQREKVYQNWSNFPLNLARGDVILCKLHRKNNVVNCKLL